MPTYQSDPLAKKVIFPEPGISKFQFEQKYSQSETFENTPFRG